MVFVLLVSDIPLHKSLMGSRLRPVSIRTVRSRDDAATGEALIVLEGFSGTFGVSVVNGRILGTSVGLTNGFPGLVGSGRILGTGVGVSVGLTSGFRGLVGRGRILGTVVGEGVGLSNGFGVALGFGRTVGMGIDFATSNK